MAAAAAAAEGHLRWVASAVALTRLPTVGDEVYYFHRGHVEQWPSLAALPAEQPMLPCTVAQIQRYTDVPEPYARITLSPANHGNQPAADPRRNPDIFVFFKKTLAHADIQRAELSVPKLCGDILLPPQEVGNTQPIQMLDLSGEAYTFQHKKSARRHDMRVAWAPFVSAKGLGVDDSVYLIRRDSDRSFFMEARRQQPPVDPVLPPLEELALAGNGPAFTVTYYPSRGSGSPFVVARGAVDEALAKHWDGGMRVLGHARDLVLDGTGHILGARLERVQGTVTEVTADQPWRKLKVNVSGSLSSWNCWEVDIAPETSPAAKRRKSAADAPPPADDQSKERAKKSKVTGTKQGGIVIRW